ncbi:MAG TPA: efflux RND transporter periplasmic adaptor subunit, partial [Acidobacteriaceae bacterium]|nr:efflux RND transporter periplasmic adaptor subunit [Acidobacteriaceae bacterium]
VRRLTRERLPVRVAEAQTQDLIKTTSTNGKVEPKNNFEAHAPAAGLIKALYVHAGDKVPQGKLLLQMDDADARAKLAAAETALRGAEAQLQAVKAGGSLQQHQALTGNIAKARLERDQAEKDLAAVEKLMAQGAAAPSEVAQSKQRLAVASTSLQSLEGQLRQPYSPIDLEHASSAVQEAQTAYAAAAQVVTQSNVRAPFAGTVYLLPVSRYEFVDAGSTLLEMADLDNLRVRAYFDEPEIGGLRLGDPVIIEWNAKPERRWHGHLVALPSTVITYGTRNVGEVLVSIEDARQDLLPNTNVIVTVTTQEVHNALAVPREALHIENARDYVYVVSGDVLRRVEVQVGALNLTQVQILSGVQEHTTVALGTTNATPLTAGVPIEIVR